MIPNVDDVRELRRLGRQEDPAAMRQRWDAATGLEARAELQRLEEVEKIIGGFERRILRAARNDADFCRLVRLDETAYSNDPANPFPSTRSDLHSEAHQKLWDFLPKTPYTPFIYREETHSSATAPTHGTYWIAAKLPPIEERATVAQATAVRPNPGGAPPLVGDASKS
jgi:hypothetical protein